MSYLLSVNTNEALNLTDALGFGGTVVLQGLATVFAVLIIIWISLMIFKFFFHDLKIGVKLKKDEPVDAKADIVHTPFASMSTDEEIISVIAAAIAAAENEAPTGAKFRVVSFKRK